MTPAERAREIVEAIWPHPFGCVCGADHAAAQAAQTRALESLLEIWGERSGNAKEESARLAWFVARNELRIALTGAPREPHA